MYKILYPSAAHTLEVYDPPRVPRPQPGVLLADVCLNAQRSCAPAWHV